MKTYLISYDPHNPGRDYATLIGAIKEVGTFWCHQLESVWLVNSGSSASEIRDILRYYLDANDELFVISLGANWATLNAGDEKNNWLRNNLIPESRAAV